MKNHLRILHGPVASVDRRFTLFVKHSIIEAVIIDFDVDGDGCVGDLLQSRCVVAAYDLCVQMEREDLHVSVVDLYFYHVLILNCHSLDLQDLVRNKLF